jgi:hypothetical protein
MSWEGVVYMIKCRDEKIENVYIGSTFNLHVRSSAHRIACKNPRRKEYTRPVYRFIRENGGWENWKIEILEINYFTPEELRTQEREYMKEYPLLLNMILPIREKK